jgi:transcription initiation factor IIE alpha subunit
MGRSHRNLIPRRVIEALLDEKVAEARRWREEHANDEPEVPGYLHF